MRPCRHLEPRATHDFATHHPPLTPAPRIRAAAEGRVALVLNQLHELTGVPGLDVVGPLPEALQQVSVFAAAVMPTARDPAAARAFVDYLAGPEAEGLVNARGLQPAAR